MNKSIDLSNIPKRGSFYNWSQSIGRSCAFTYNKITGILTIIDYKSDGKNGFVKIQYDDKIAWLNTSAFKRCQIGGVFKFFTSDFHYQVGDIIHCKTDLKILDRQYKYKNDRQRKLYTYQCLTCKQIHETFEQQLNEFKGCPYCSGKIVKAGVNDITTTAPWMIGFFDSTAQASQYTAKSTCKIFPRCPVCGRKQTKEKSICDLYYSHTSGCICDSYMSFAEQIIFNLLTQNNIYFIHRATKKELPWAQKYEYDFYLPQQKIIIEAHGAQHYESHGFSTVGGKTLQEEQINDENKQLLAQQQSINYFIIDCRKSNLDFILKNIEESGLLKTLNLIVKDKNQLYNNILNTLKEKLKQLMIEQNFNKTQLIQKLDISSKTLNYLLKII